MSTKIFDHMELTAGESEFINNVLADNKPADIKTAYVLQAQILATLHLSKNIEASSKQSDKTAKAMLALTAALAFIAFLNLWPVFKTWFQ